MAFDSTLGIKRREGDSLNDSSYDGIGINENNSSGSSNSSSNSRKLINEFIEKDID